MDERIDCSYPDGTGWLVNAKFHIDCLVARVRLDTKSKGLFFLGGFLKIGVPEFASLSHPTFATRPWVNLNQSVIT